jgi:hypothetical protein
LSLAYRGHLLSHLTDVFDDTTSSRFDWRAFDPNKLRRTLTDVHDVPTTVCAAVVRMWADPVKGIHHIRVQSAYFIYSKQMRPT